MKQRYIDEARTRRPGLNGVTHETPASEGGPGKSIQPHP
jgi:hypothetical protein